MFVQKSPTNNIFHIGKNGFQTVFSLLFIFFVSWNVSAQINFLNPGLNGSSAAGAAPPQWTVCASTPDVQPTIFCVDLAPKEGATYAGFSDDEFIGQKLNCALVQGKNYSMSLWLAYNPDYARTQALGACPDAGIRGNPGNFQLWGGKNQCQKSELLFESGQLSAAHENNWIEHNIKFSPNQTYDYILICAKPSDGSQNVLVDNISQQIVQEPDSFASDNTNIICFDDKTASATVYPPNIGGSNYTYSWNTSPVQTTQTATNIGVGTYICTITDNNGACSSTYDVPVTITGPPELVINMVCTDVSGPGVIDGTSTANVSGGVPPYTYSWDTGETTDNIGGLDEGTYTVTVTDSKGCTITGFCDILNPWCDLEFTNTSFTDVSCFGADDGTITVATSSTNQPVTYSWDTSPVQTSATATNLPPGTYTVTASDAASCNITQTFTISEPPVLDVVLAAVPATCFGGSDGQANATPSGGTPPYSYSWTGGSTTNSYTGLAGNITVTVTDDNNCTVQKSILVDEPAQLQIDTNLTKSSCPEVDDGIIEFIPSGGQRDYSFSIDGVNYQADSIFTGLAHNNYTLYIKDAANCEYNMDVELLTDSVKVIAPNDTNICRQQEVVLAATGMDNMFWDDGSPNGASLFPLASTSLIVTGVNTSGCTDKDTFDITVTPYYDPTINPAGPFCTGSPDFQLTAADPGGKWTGAVQDTLGLFSPANVGNGTFDVIYTFAGNCGDADTFNILVNSIFDATIDPVSPVCELNDAFELTSTTPGGKWWGPGMAGNNIDSISPFFHPQIAGPGNHTITHLIPSECGDTATIVINVIQADRAQITNVPDFCPTGTPQQIQVTPSNGTWTGTGMDGAGNFDPSLAPSPGNYTIVYTPSGNCFVRDTANVTVVTQITAVPDTFHLACFQDNNGVLNSLTSGGQAPYNYQWPTGVTNSGAQATGLTAGQYPTTTTDNLGCSVTVTNVVTEPSGMSFTAPPTIINDSCNASCTGAATFFVTGGANTNGYSFDLNGTTQSSNVFRNLCAGAYVLTVTDDNGCSISDNFTITEPQALQINATPYTATCNQPNGGITVANVTGGTTPYTFSWSDGSNQQSLDNVLPGNYTLTITDKNNCTLVYNDDVPNFGGPDLTSSFDSVSCYNGNDGVAYVIATGGSPGYTYSWDVGSSTSASNPNLSAGSYVATVSDNTGCANQITIVVEEPNEVMVNPIQDTLLCTGQVFNATFGATGGNGTQYTYTANGNTVANGNFQQNTAGTVDVIATDSKGCVSPIMSFQINYRTPINPIAGGPYTVCPGDLVNISASATRGLGSNYTYLWEDGLTGASRDYHSSSNSQRDSILVTVNDGCSDENSTYVYIDFHPNSLPIPVITPPNGCVPLDVRFSLGTTPYNQVSWKLENGQEISDLADFNYVFEEDGRYPMSVSVTSVEGCNSTVQIPPIEVYPLPNGKIQQSPIRLTIANNEAYYTVPGSNITNVRWSLSGYADGSIENYVGTPFIYAFERDTASYLLQAELISPFGCLDTIYKPVQVFDEIRLYVPKAFSPNNDGANDNFNIGHIGLEFKKFEIGIYNRWGEELFRSSDSDFSWDGIYQGEIAKPGIYVWVINYTDEFNEEKTLHGNVLIIK